MALLIDGAAQALSLRSALSKQLLMRRLACSVAVNSISGTLQHFVDGQRLVPEHASWSTQGRPPVRRRWTREGARRVSSVGRGLIGFLEAAVGFWWLTLRHGPELSFPATTASIKTCRDAFLIFAGDAARDAG